MPVSRQKSLRAFARWGPRRTRFRRGGAETGGLSFMLQKVNQRIDDRFGLVGVPDHAAAVDADEPRPASPGD